MAHRLLPPGLYVSIFCMFACVAGETLPAVRPGIDVLLADSALLLEGRRVGLLTNHTGIDRDGRADLERLRDAGAQVTAIFSPEHGYRGRLDRADIEHGIDSATGLPVFSLYGETREPTPAMLAGMDLLLSDLQDIGARCPRQAKSDRRSAGPGSPPRPRPPFVRRDVGSSHAARDDTR